MELLDDIVIGTGYKGTSATKVFAIPGDHGVSENRASYWIHDAYLGMSMVIFKSSGPGAMLSRFIEEKRDPEEIFEWIEDIAIENVGHKMLKEAVTRTSDRAFHAGREAKAREIRCAIMLE